MGSIAKLIQKARQAPQNLSFAELCRLCEHFGMRCRKKPGSHRTYRRDLPPKLRPLSVQNCGGKAKAYQVEQLLKLLEEHGLLDPEEVK